MKKSKRQNIVILSVGIIIIGAIVVYNYSFEQTRQKGLRFGNELQQIQEEVKQIESELSSKIKQLKEGDLTQQELIQYSEIHFAKLEQVILKYDDLIPPEQFIPSVKLFEISTRVQLDSDKEFIEWIKTNEDSHKIRSDSLFQESFEYEMTALKEFNDAKDGKN